VDPLRGYLWRFGIAFAASVLATFAVRAAARRLKLVAKPRPDRWHRKPTALFGGVGIFAGFLAAYLVRRPAAMDGDVLLAVCASGMFLLGLVDDKIQLRPSAKLIGQIVCATLFTTFGLRLHWLPNPILDQGLTIFWLVGVTNALNLLDNIDGAAAGIAAIAGAYLVYFCHHAGHVESAAMAAAFTGAVIGFLIFNFNPASIFMGDCGSLFLGFFLGGLSLVNSEVGARKNILAVLSIPVLLLLLPILDTTLVTISRRYHGRPASQGGRDHTSHRLVAIGMSERRATLTLWFIAAASGGLAVLVTNVSVFLAAGLIAVFAFGLLFLMIFLGRVKVYESVESESEARGRALLPTLADFSYKRRVFEILNDLALIILCYYGAYLLRFENATTFPTLFIRSLPLVIISQLGVFLALGLYRGVWRYTGIDDLVLMVKAVGAGVILSTVTVLFAFRFEGFSRAVVVIDGAMLLLGIAGSRISFRLLRSWLVRHRPTGAGKRVLIYGAGDGGELLLREILNNRDLGMIPVAFLDDDPQKAGRVIHGVPVMGSGAEVARIVSSMQVHEVLLSTSKVDADRWELVTRACGERGLGCRRMRIAFD
jgi:UDP-GlcNAc:undecaprenyl-phosphate/decaprenyl-phosphate GlcNAc-1-phosphate transferase